MKILHVHKFFHAYRGAEVYLHGLMRQQEEDGHEVHVLSTRHPANLPSGDADRFITGYDLSANEGLIKDAKKATNFLWNMEARRAMKRALREIKPDVIHLHNIYHHFSTSILPVIRKSGVPCFQTLHDLKLACPNYRMYTENAPCERCKGGRYWETVKHRCVYRGFLPNVLAAAEMGFTKAVQAYERTVRVFICPSNFMAEKMKEWGEPPSKFKVIASPVVKKKPAERRGGYLLAVGSLTQEKGYELLIKAAARVPSIKIRIAGAGILENKIRTDIKSLGAENIELVGRKQGEELANLYHQAEAFVACPIGYENAPLTVLDALGYQLPILATNIGGLPEMVEHGVNGYLVERGSVDGWAEALKKFSGLPDDAKSAMAIESGRLAEKNYPDWPGHARLVEEVYRSAF